LWLAQGHDEALLAEPAAATLSLAEPAAPQPAEIPLVATSIPSASASASATTAAEPSVAAETNDSRPALDERSKRPSAPKPSVAPPSPDKPESDSARRDGLTDENPFAE
jgi:hypothetical protein